MSSAEWIGVFRQDLRYAIRQLRSNPGFTVTALLTIALGIGAATTIFSVTDAMILRPLPYPNSNQLMLVWDTLAKIGVRQMPVSAEDFDAFRTNIHIFQSIVAFQQEDRNLITPGSAERVSAISSTPGLLDMLGGVSVIGRSFTQDDWQPDRTSVAIISHSLFMRQFSGDHAVIGNTFRLDDRIYTIVGVLGKDFQFSTGTGAVEIWTPLPPVTDYRKQQFQVLARLNPGIAVSTAQQAITATARRLEQTTHPYRGPNGEDPGYTATVISLHDQLFGSFRRGTLILMSTVMLVLLIACVNVANLLIARGAAREKEMAVRRVLGASRIRLVRQWLTEAALLAFCGGSAGLLASHWGVLLLKPLIPGDLPGIAHIDMNRHVLLFTFAISAAVCVLSGFAPLLTSTPNDASLRGPRRRRRLSNALVSTEVALAFVLIVGSGLLLKSFEHLRRIDPGFRSDHLLTMKISLSGSRYENPAERIHFFSQLQQRLSQLPGVISASAIDRLPVFTVGVDTRSGNPFSVDGHPFNPNSAAQQLAHTQTVEGNYFTTMGIPLLAGRTFSANDTTDAQPVAVINQTLARSIFPQGDAIGRRILLGAPEPGARWMTIVGIIGDVRTGALDLPPMPQFYTPATQDAPPRMFVILRTMLDPLLMEHAAASVVHQVAPEQPVQDIATMQQHVDATMGQPRFQTSLLSFFAASALFLAGIGIYGAVTNATIQRTKEIGIRMALGANHSRVLTTVLAEGLRPVLFGIVVGLTGAILLARLLVTSLYQVGSGDSMTIVAAVLVLGSTAIVACLAPARRATRVSPMETLRFE
jgi:putative ABC transport system permease protein